MYHETRKIAPGTMAAGSRVRRGRAAMRTTNTTTYSAALRLTDIPAAAMPNWLRIRFITNPMSIKLVIRPMLIAMTFALAVTFPPVSQTRLLDATSVGKCPTGHEHQEQAGGQGQICRL